MSIDFEMRLNLRMIATSFAAATPIALARGAEVVRAKAVERTPVQSGRLKGEAGVTVTGVGLDSVAEIKYGGRYAAFQNRGMRADGTHVILNRPGGGQNGFLTESIEDQRDAAFDAVAETFRQLNG